MESWTRRLCKWERGIWPKPKPFPLTRTLSPTYSQDPSRVCPHNLAGMQAPRRTCPGGLVGVPGSDTEDKRHQLLSLGEISWSFLRLATTSATLTFCSDKLQKFCTCHPETLSLPCAHVEGFYSDRLGVPGSFPAPPSLVDQSQSDSRCHCYNKKK